MRNPKIISEQVHAFLTQHRLEPLPHNYHLAYAYLDGSHAELAKAVNLVVDGGVRISQDQATGLYERFCGRAVTPYPPELAAAVSIRQQALRLADLVAAASASTGEFKRDLSDRLPTIDVADPAILTQLVAAMIERTQRAERELAATTAEVEKLRQKLEAVQGDAEHDILTGLPNRRGLEAYFATLKQSAGPRALALCDIDRFKTYNDKYGHGVGDRVLKTVAGSLRECLPRHFVCRWGGEEFLIIVQGDVATAVGLIEAAKDTLGATHFRLRETDEPMGRITFSAGVAALLPETNALEAALKKADALLYRAKSEGRDRVIGE